MDTSHQTAIKRAIALEMLDAGKPMMEIAQALGYDRRSKAVQFFERNGIKVPARLLSDCRAKRADGSEADASGLTEAQLERAASLGITPGRFASLLTCERGTSQFSHPQPGVAYTRNSL